MKMFFLTTFASLDTFLILETEILEKHLETCQLTELSAFYTNKTQSQPVCGSSPLLSFCVSRH